MRSALLRSSLVLLVVSVLQCGSQAGTAEFGDPDSLDVLQELHSDSQEDGVGPDFIQDLTEQEVKVTCEVGKPCDDLNPCTKDDFCKGGLCSGTKYSCEDEYECTRDACLGDGTCQNVLRPGYCLIDEACYEEGDANPELPCVECVTAASTSEWTADNTNTCEDGDPCTGPDMCLGGMCTGKPKVCPDDSNPCTKPVCISGTCTVEPTAGACVDEDPCTVDEECQEGACVPGSTLNCDDSNPCTDDLCVDGLGCRNLPNMAACDDGNPCTLNDTCGSSKCIPGKTLQVCDDLNPCTDDSCHPTLGCVAFPNNAPCDDGDPCLEGDFCVAGACQPGFTQITCVDGEGCTDDFCEPFVGCIFPANSLSCDDGNPCTLNDFCQQKLCVGGPGSLECDDDNECTKDYCLDGTGCVNEPIAAGICNDDNVCTEFDQCVAGSCEGLKVQCNDGNACTADACDPLAGCYSNVLNTPECRPNIVITWPPRGVTLNQDVVVVVTGTVSSAAAPITGFTINDGQVNVNPDGSFAFPMTAVQAMNLIRAQATDMLGGVGNAVQSFYYSPLFYPIDVANPQQSMVKDGLMIFLGPDVWDDNDTSDVDDIATILTLYLEKMDLNSMITNPVTTTSFLQCTYKINVSNITFGTPSIDLKPVSGGLSLGIVLPNFKANVVLDASGFLCPGASGTTGASSVSVASTVLVSVSSAGEVNVTLQSLTVSLNGFYLTLSGVTGTLLNWLIGLFSDSIADQLETALRDQLSAMIPGLLADVLQSLALNQSFDVPPFIGEGDPVTLQILTGLSSATFDVGGAELGLKATVVTPKTIAHTPHGSIGRANCLAGTPELYKMPRAGQLEIALHDDVLNQIPFGLYWGGLLNLDLGPETLGDLSTYGVTDLLVHLDALLPPVLTSCNPEGELRIQIGDMQVDATMNLFGCPITLTAFLSIELQADIVVVDGAAGKELSIAIGDLRVFEIQIVSLTGALVGAEEILINLIKDNLVGALVDGLGGGALGSFPIPAIDLSSIDPTLPAGSVIELALTQVMRLFGYTTLSGNVKE